jgi:hypothetical protein
MSIDWNKVKFRASSWGNLLAEPQSKADKDAGRLGVTCQKELIKIYNLVKYGRKKEIVTKHMEKGVLAEQGSIDLYSMVERRRFFKNETKLENEWFTGHPDISDTVDIYNAYEIDDIKSSWELDTFTPKLLEETDKAYIAQLNVYFSLTGAQTGAIVYCLVNCPASVLLDEQRRLLYSMDVVSEESPAYLEAAKELERNLTFDDIDFRERVIKKIVHRDDELIEKMKAKVPILRTWLAEFEEKHLSQYKKKYETERFL